MGVLCILSCGIAVIGITLLFLFYHDVKGLHKQLRYKQRSGSQFDVFIESSLPIMKQLQQDIQDIYQKNREIEEAALHKEKEMQTLLSGISHDIRTPLTSIQGYFRLMKETQDEAEKEGYLDIIHFRLRSLQSMLDNLFAYAKMQDEDYRINMEPVEVYPLLCKLLASFYYEFEKKQIEPVLSFSNEQLCVKADKELLLRLLHNLISNAWKHGASYFAIREEKGTIFFINEIQSSQALDTERLFDRFYKADDARRTTDSGLGLSIVKQIAELHHWKLEASQQKKKLQIALTLHP